MHGSQTGRHILGLGELIAGAVLLFGLASPVAADVFVLRSGGQIEGEWLNRV